MPPEWALQALRSGLVIPAHPLALTANGEFDERRQRALTRYYHAAGAGGLAVGVHTTQFEIRQHGLYEPVLHLAQETVSRCDAQSGGKTVLIAGVVGATSQAVKEARLAQRLGYHAGMLSLGALRQASETELLDHCRAVASEIPLVGFYLQPAAGGRLLAYSFWRRMVEIPNLVMIKVAPFNRYQTLDVLRAVAESGRAGEIALYTGNDDQIILDLLTEFQFQTPSGPVNVHIAGGLLGQWACWTKRAVEILEIVKDARQQEMLPKGLLTLAAQLTEANAAIFDAANGFAGSIAGVHEVLRRQGLLETTRCLNPVERLSPGQVEEIDRVSQAYPHLTDDEFVAGRLVEWLE